MSHVAPEVGERSSSIPESVNCSPDSLRRKLEDLLNELAYIDEYPDRWESPHARAVRRIVVLTEIRHCRSMLPRMERRRLLA